MLMWIAGAVPAMAHPMIRSRRAASIRKSGAVYIKEEAPEADPGVQRWAGEIHVKETAANGQVRRVRSGADTGEARATAHQHSSVVQFAVKAAENMKKDLATEVEAVPVEKDLQAKTFCAAGSTCPQFNKVTGAANPFDGIDLGYQSVPTFTDLDGDGDLDLVAGERHGLLKLFERTGADTFVERTGDANPFDGIDVGTGYSAPAFTDLDGDGDLDLVVGEYHGTLKFFERTGADTFVERTGDANPFNGIDVGPNSKPGFFDFDGDGDLDLAVADWNPEPIHYFERTGAMTFEERTGDANPFNALSNSGRATLAFADLDGDGDLDLVVGRYGGSLKFFERTGAATFVERAGAANPLDGIYVGTEFSPAFADIDADGALDLVVGEAGGRFWYLKTQCECNTAPSPSPTAYPTASPTADPTANPTASPTASPTGSPTPTPTPAWTDCIATVYEHWPENITATLADAVGDNSSLWNGFPTGLTDHVTVPATVHEMTFPLQNVSQLASSVKISGVCCQAVGYTSSDCSGAAAGESINAATSYTAGNGVVAGAARLASLSYCNDCLQCVKVYHQC